MAKGGADVHIKPAYFNHNILSRYFDYTTLDDGETAKKQVVKDAGELVQKNPDKFRVVQYDLSKRNSSLTARTILAFEDGEIILQLRLMRSPGFPQQRLDVYKVLEKSKLFPEPRLEVIYRLDILEGRDGREDIMIDRYTETKVTAQTIKTLLKSYSEIQLPDTPLDNPFAPTLGKFMGNQKTKGEDSAVTKLLT